MYFKEMGDNAKNWVDTAHVKDYYSICERGTEPRRSISLGVS